MIRFLARREKRVDSAWAFGPFSCVKALTLVVLAVVVLSGCSNDTVPVDSALTITPESHSTHITERQSAQGQCLFDANNHVDIPILMLLTTANGSPIGEATLNVYTDFAANTYSGLPVLSLYDDLNSNGVVDADSELISGTNDSIARVKTGQWTGARSLLLRVNLSCAFKGEVFAFTGGISGRASIDVVAQDVLRPPEIPQNDAPSRL